MDPWSPLELGLVVGGLLVVVIHGAFALGVARESRRYTTDVHAMCLLVPRWIWILTTLIGGPLVGTMLWIRHWSGLNRRLVD